MATRSFRSFCLMASLLAMLVLGPGSLRTPAAIAQLASQPNVVVILVDDMGWSDIGPFGSEISTPNLDALAANGIRFTQFYATTRCSPSRASLLTGLYPHQAGMGHLDTMIRSGFARHHRPAQRPVRDDSRSAARGRGTSRSCPASGTSVRTTARLRGSVGSIARSA